MYPVFSTRSFSSCRPGISHRQDVCALHDWWGNPWLPREEVVSTDVDSPDSPPDISREALDELWNIWGDEDFNADYAGNEGRILELWWAHVWVVIPSSNPTEISLSVRAMGGVPVRSSVMAWSEAAKTKGPHQSEKNNCICWVLLAILLFISSSASSRVALPNRANKPLALSTNSPPTAVEKDNKWLSCNNDWVRSRSSYISSCLWHETNIFEQNEGSKKFFFGYSSSVTKKVSVFQFESYIKLSTHTHQILYCWVSFRDFTLLWWVQETFFFCCNSNSN